MTQLKRALLTLVPSTMLLGLLTVAVHAQETDKAAAGKAIAEQYCARCHAIDKSDVSKLPIAPPFRTFAAKWPVESLEEALAEGIVTGHPDMPVFQFEPDQIAALLEHLHAISDKPNSQ